MENSIIKQLPKSTVELTVTIPWSEVKKTYDEIVSHAITEIELPGFRKGKAPRNLAESKLDKSKLYEEVIKRLIPKLYEEAVKQHTLKPIANPKIDLLEAAENKDWKIRVLIAQKPKVVVKNYKQAIQGVKSQKKLWVPGQKEEKPDEKITMDQILTAVLKESEVEIPDILIEEEINRLLTRLIDETKLLGLTVEQYLRSKGKTVEQLRSEYRQQAETTLKLEFVLEEIADSEKITVTPKDIDDALSKVESEADRKRIASDSYYLASILRRQKTLDSLLNPIV